MLFNCHIGEELGGAPQLDDRRLRSAPGFYVPSTTRINQQNDLAQIPASPCDATESSPEGVAHTNIDLVQGKALSNEF